MEGGLDGIEWVILIVIVTGAQQGPGGGWHGMQGNVLDQRS
jgi:hypothetical protein